MHELTRLLQQRRGEPRVHRVLLYPVAQLAEANDDPIKRYLVSDNSLALTTLRLNGTTEMTDARIGSVLFPTRSRRRPRRSAATSPAGTCRVVTNTTSPSGLATTATTWLLRRKQTPPPARTCG